MMSEVQSTAERREEIGSEALATTTPIIRNQSNSAILGDVAWLMMGSGWHRGHSVKDFVRLVMPPIGHRQFRLFYEGEQPIAYVSWASLSPEIEKRFIADPSSLDTADWASGEATYLVDIVAPKGALGKIARRLRTDPLLSKGPIRGLKVRNGTRMMVEITGSATDRRIRTARLG